MPEKFGNATIIGHFGFVFEENSSAEGKHGTDRDVIVCEKVRFQNVFCPQLNAKPGFSNSSVLT